MKGMFSSCVLKRKLPFLSKCLNQMSFSIRLLGRYLKCFDCVNVGKKWMRVVLVFAVTAVTVSRDIVPVTSSPPALKDAVC